MNLKINNNENKHGRIKKKQIEINVQVAHDYVRLKQGDNTIEISNDVARRMFEQILKCDYQQESHTSSYAQFPTILHIEDWKTGFTLTYKTN